MARGTTVAGRLERMAAIAIVLTFCLLGAAIGARAATLAGTYRPATAHPFVFADAAGYGRLLTAQTPVVRAALATLESRAAADLKQGKALTEAYSGCDLDQYLHHLTYEESGAAKAAAELALYAYLAGQNKGYGRADWANAAQALSKAILLGWSRHGLRAAGAVRTSLDQFCEKGATNLVSRLDTGLQIGRGFGHWVIAQDLLSALGAFSPAEQRDLDGFLDQVYRLMLVASNFWAEHAYSDCERYSNHTSVHILAMLAIARLRNDPRRFQETATGAGGLRIPWTDQVTENIYGVGTRPRDCHPEGSTPGYRQIDTVAPGEIVDRYRAGPLQTLGYPIYSLSNLLLAAEILSNAGYQPMRFKGAERQSLTLALDYYSYYFTAFMSDEAATIAARPGTPYPSEAQYIGHPLGHSGAQLISGENEHLLPFVIGYALDPRDPKLIALLHKAMSFAPRVTPFHAVDSIAANCLVALPQSP